VGLGGQTLVALLRDAQLDALALGQGDVGLVALANDEHVGQTGGEHMALGVLNVHNVEGSWVTLAVDNGADTSQIPASGDHAEVACGSKKTFVSWNQTFDLVNATVIARKVTGTTVDCRIRDRRDKKCSWLIVFEPRNFDKRFVVFEPANENRS